MRKIASYAMAVLCFFIFCRAEAAVFNVTNVAELQTALTTAQSNGEADTINLAPGTYVLSSGLRYSPVTSENFSLTIQGAGAWATILDGGGSHSILRIEQGALLDGTNANVTIRGVTFRNASESSLLGGALFIGNYDAQTTIEDCVFQNNTAVFGGGALYLEGWSAQFARNTFTGNSSTDVSSAGGGVYALLSGGTLTLDSNTVSDNFSVGWSAGIYAANPGPIVLTKNTFSNNVAEGWGGGAFVSAEFGGSLSVSGNKFTGNFGSSAGGAYLASMSGAAIISRNVFRNNTASTSSQSEGGGVVVFSQNVLKMMNNLFVGNTTSERGAGAMIYLNKNQNQITNNTFAGNKSTGVYSESGSLGGGMYVTTDKNDAVLNIYNNIFWGNTAVAPGSNGADAYINDDGLNDGVGSIINLYNNDFSDIRILVGDNIFQGGNIINENPTFDPEYRLTAGSPCIDTGNNGAPELPAIDLGRDPRVQNGVVDMGAYEWGPRGTLGVTISPQGAVDAGAKWQVDGGEWHVSGETEKVLAGVGGHTVEFSEVAGWVKPVSQTLTIDAGQTVSLSGVYTATGPTGSLGVTISPQGAVDAGAKWQVDGGVWHDSGYTQTGLSVGQHTVVYSDIMGWTNPGIQTVTITQGETANVTGTYAPQPTGSLRVTISPQGAIDGGAHWRMVGGAWHVSGYTQRVSVGQYTVEFSDLAGWVKPANQTVTITEGQTINISGTYTQPTGSLKVTISPSAAVTAGAKWRRAGTSTWRDSGTTESGIPVGQYTVEFKSLAGWTKPGNKTVTISAGKTTNISGTYIQLFGSLVVTILPQAAIDGGAQWQVDGGDWHKSGDIQTGLSAGQHWVTFSEVAGWAKPGNRAVTVSSGQTTAITEIYTQATGSLMVTILPQEAINAAAKWRVDGGPWRVSGYTQPGLSVGSHMLEFSDIAGWIKPSNQTVTISDSQTTNTGGIYVKQPGSLTVTISPQGAIDAGAQWRRVGTSAWQNSGVPETGIPVGAYTVEFKNVSGWTTPASQPVTISSGQTTTATGTYAYALQVGSLLVTITPQGAINAGAQWRRVGTSTWQNSGVLEIGIPVGPYTVEFKDVSGWTKPTGQPVTITDSQTATVVGRFDPNAVPFPFFDDFSTDKGWAGFEPGGWQRGPASAGSVESGNPDPEADHTQTGDNYLLGYNIGGGYPNSLLEEKAIISPAIDCTGQLAVFLKFWRYLNVEGTDDARIYVSHDKINWALIWENSESGIFDDHWTPAMFDISPYAAGQGTVYIKFTMGPSDEAGSYSGWNIDDLEVSSNPVFPAEGTMGTEFSIGGSSFGAKKGKVLIGNTSLKNKSLTVPAWTNGLIRSRLAGVLPPGAYDVTVAPSGSAPIIHKKAFVVKPPEIHSIERADGTAGDRVTIHGRFFGTGKGKVYLEYEKDGSPYRTNCQVLSWIMDPASGESQIVFVVPKMVPQVCDLVVDPYAALPETEEVDGFAVKLPEIVSLNSSVGTAWDQITIHGNFFGMKKGTVYLGYSVKGKPMKKNCSVASWTMDPATEKGDIVFVVPQGLVPGAYDLIVTNTVGSRTVAGGFTVMAPQIVSVNPTGGKAGDQITIHGKFFGMKKGTVYLGYLVNGKPIKKSCLVVSWTVDPGTKEGDIVFEVPQGLAPGVYDLIVTNSAGSDTDVFTIDGN